MVTRQFRFAFPGGTFRCVFTYRNDVQDEY